MFEQNPRTLPQRSMIDLDLSELSLRNEDRKVPRRTLLMDASKRPACMVLKTPTETQDFETLLRGIPEKFDNNGRPPLHFWLLSMETYFLMFRVTREDWRVALGLGSLGEWARIEFENSHRGLNIENWSQLKSMLNALFDADEQDLCY